MFNIVFYDFFFNLQVDNGFHLMEIEAIESKKANHLSITLIHEHKPVSILIGKCYHKMINFESKQGLCLAACVYVYTFYRL